MNVSSRYLLRPFIHKSSVYLHFYDIIDRYTYFFRLQLFHIIYCNWKVNLFLYLFNHYAIVTYGRVVVQFERLLTSNLDMACGIKLTYVLTEYINPLWAAGLSVFVRGFSFFFSQPLYIVGLTAHNAQWKQTKERRRHQNSISLSSHDRSQ